MKLALMAVADLGSSFEGANLICVWVNEIFARKREKNF